MTPFSLRALAALTLCMTTVGIQVSTDAGLGYFEGHGDVGSPAIAGTASYDPATQAYRMTAAGTNMWAARDEFQFAWRKMSGDFLITASTRFEGAGVDPHRKLGLIIRTSLDPGSPYVDVAGHGDGLTSLQFRRTPGANTEQVQSAVTRADVLQLERRGRTLHHVGGPRGRPVHAQRGERRRSRRRGVRRAVPLLAQPGGGRERGVPQRADHGAAEGRLGAVPGLHREQRRDPLAAERRPHGGRHLADLGAGAELDARRQVAALEQRRASCTCSTSSRAPRRCSTPASPRATTTITC